MLVIQVNLPWRLIEIDRIRIAFDANKWCFGKKFTQTFRYSVNVNTSLFHRETVGGDVAHPILTDHFSDHCEIIQFIVKHPIRPCSSIMIWCQHTKAIQWL